MNRLTEYVNRHPLLEWARLRTWRFPELPVLIALAGVAFTTWTFIELADEVVGGDTRRFDEAVISALRDPDDPRLPRGPTWLADGARDLTALGSTAVLTLFVVIVAGYLALVRRPRAVAILLAAVISGAILTTGLKTAFDRPRPESGSALQNTHTASFPSGHSLSSALVYLTLGAMLARVMPTRKLHFYVMGVPLVLAVLVGLTRVYLGVHYPTDVLAGWAAGAGWALLWWLIARWSIARSEPQVES